MDNKQLSIKLNTTMQNIIKIQEFINNDINNSTILLYLDSFNQLITDLKFSSTVFNIQEKSLLYCLKLIDKYNYDNLIKIIEKCKIEFIKEYNKQYHEIMKYIDYAIEETDVNIKQMETVLHNININYETIINTLSNIDNLMNIKDIFFYNNSFNINITYVKSGITKYVKNNLIIYKSKSLYFSEKLSEFKNKFYNTINFNPSKTYNYCYHCNTFHCYHYDCFSEYDDCYICDDCFSEYDYYKCNEYYPDCDFECNKKCNVHFCVDTCILKPKLYFIDNEDICKLFKQNEKLYFFKDKLHIKINIKNMEYIDEFDVGQNLYNRFSKNKLINFINFNEYEKNDEHEIDKDHINYIKMLNKSLKYLYKHCDNKINLLCLFEYIIALYYPDKYYNINYRISNTIISLHKKIIYSMFKIINSILPNYINVN